MEQNGFGYLYPTQIATYILTQRNAYIYVFILIIDAPQDDVATYIHTYIHTYNAYIHVFILVKDAPKDDMATYIRTYMHTCIPCIHAYICSN
jgi:hypothetical protein